MSAYAITVLPFVWKRLVTNVELLDKQLHRRRIRPGVLRILLQAPSLIKSDIDELAGEQLFDLTRPVLQHGMRLLAVRIKLSAVRKIREVRILLYAEEVM